MSGNVWSAAGSTRWPIHRRTSVDSCAPKSTSGPGSRSKSAPTPSSVITGATVHPDLLASAIAQHWDAQIVPQLFDYIRIPAKSPHFDPEWSVSGHLERVIQLALSWVTRQGVRGLHAEIVRLAGSTPL